MKFVSKKSLKQKIANLEEELNKVTELYSNIVNNFPHLDEVSCPKCGSESYKGSSTGLEGYVASGKVTIARCFECGYKSTTRLTPYGVDYLDVIDPSKPIKATYQIWGKPFSLEAAVAEMNREINIEEIKKEHKKKYPTTR